MATRQTYLTNEQHDKLCTILKKYEVLFDGKLGCYPHEQFHIDLVNGMKLVYNKPYGVTYQHKELFKKEL